MYRFSQLRRFILSVKTFFLARFDAKYKTPSPDLVVDRYLGPRPAFDPGTNPEHTEIAKNLLTKDLDKYTKDLHTVQNQLTAYSASWLFTWGLIVLFLCEYLGASLIFKDLGYAPRERLVLGLMLAAMLFFLTWFAAHMATRTDDQGKPVRSKWLIAVLVAYTVLAVAVGIFRHQAIATGEEGTRASDLATSLVMVFTSIGPAWLAETLMRKREPIARFTRMKRQLHQRSRKARRDQQSAQARMRHLSRLGEAWDHESKRLRAVYMHTYRRAYLRNHGTTPPEEPRSAFGQAPDLRVIHQRQERS